MDRDFLKDVKRVVVKIGTNSIMKDNGEINLRQLDRLAYVCSALIQDGYEVLLVTSGAIGVGASLMQLDTYPTEIPRQQAISSIGQSKLMTLYSQFFNNYNQHVGQILFTRDVIDFPVSYQNMQNALNALLDKKIIPIINENDAVSVDEMNHKTIFGDNDTLSAIVAQTIEADLLIILSDVEGLYDKNPQYHEEAELIDWVPEITDDILEMGQGKGSEFAKGGMATKLSAAKIMLDNHSYMIIASASDPTVIFDIVEGKKVGTLFGNKTKENEDGRTL